MTSQSSKVYIEIVKQIRSIIQDDGLSTGDKIPSERELSDRLNVGRSSVREALRSLELLGLIETRRGEGTFLKDFGDHQLIHLLGTFIIQGDKTKDDLLETKQTLEKSCIELACHQINDQTITELKRTIWDVEDPEEYLFKTIAEATGNRLLLRIWVVINEYVKFIYEEQTHEINKEGFDELVDALSKRDVEKALSAYEKITL
ncbi:GntR family transcriptional regulator [Fredinandcohnia sp. QZ13]|uniref:FadR/GntR family transcriptional regulator n=1 Tax=Fredinandcohnia sp. QZ13 TaxID=3073144 RepID=UPI00285335BC|nr:GntR family transcriptional regulator [Fredinandcohnia sp. QZ13]MDR4889218.1 GntR family transcriptional regulator [Fredinandcohnia sp. QZ13]